MSIETLTATAPSTRTEHSKKITLTLLTAAYLFAFCTALNYQVEAWSFEVIPALLRHMGATVEFMAEALGGSLLVLIPLHIGIASIFKSKRNSTSRWNIARGWAITSLVLQTIVAIVQITKN